MNRFLAASLLCLSAHTLVSADDRISKAVDKSVRYIRSRQDPKDGCFRDKWSHAYPMGESAICLLALLKGGVGAKDPVLKLGFHGMMSQPFKKVYGVSLAILALEARYAPPPLPRGDVRSLQTVVRKYFKKKARGADKKWLGKAAQFLIRNQKSNGLWNYPFGGADDLSNAQFALLALKSAKRLGVSVPDSIWLRSLDYLLRHQEAKGPMVPRFAVPAAAGPIRQLKLAEMLHETVERGDYRARGWGYKPGQGARGSMTAAGVACLVVIKSELERHKAFRKRFAKKVNIALRDGSAWLAKAFRADVHPGADLDWLFYWLYTLERAGTLSGVHRFGSHDWYRAGCEQILKLQKTDGSFERPTSGETDGLLAGSAFALLFLKRSTVPVIERPITAEPSPAAGDAGAPLGVTSTVLPDGRYRVSFRYRPEGGAARVALAGSFNDWSKDASLLTDSDGDGVYELSVTLEAGRHSYKFVLDGDRWLCDPKNPKGEGDGHGGRNSVLELGS